jgi:peptidoglycan/LPS O-acetylase OafA/YrhL
LSTFATSAPPPAGSLAETPVRTATLRVSSAPTASADGTASSGVDGPLLRSDARGTQPASAAPDVPYLGGLDGLRALSVAAVILYHAQVTGFDGGFFGVEVFFVISGFLITSLLLAERERAGAISLPHFWIRRARRLLPALSLLLVGTLVIAATVAGDGYAQTRTDLPAAIFFVSNWWQLASHHSYFMAVERPPLLQHLWSLAVEEQFYIVFPPLFALLGMAVRKSPRRWLALIAGAGAIGSAVWMATLFDPAVDPSGVYLRTDTRLSGLLLGVTLAALAPAFNGTRATRATRVGNVFDGLGIAGLGCVLWAFTQWRDTDPFVYRLGFGVVDVASAAMIASAALGRWMPRALGWAPLRWIGLRSYGLYLWHWPIMAVTRPDFDTTWSGWQLLALRLGLTLVATELSYRFVEAPIRRAGLVSVIRGLGSPGERARSLRVVGVMATIAATGVLVMVAPVRADGPRGDANTSPDTNAPTTDATASTVPSLASSPSLAVADPQPASAPRPEPAPAGAGVPVDPAWPKTLTLLTDSVTLGVKQALPAAMPDWHVEFVGRPALMVKQVVPEFLKDKKVGSVVVVGVAYNSLFEKNRRNYDKWAATWDKEAERLLSDLRERGAKKIVWVTLREPSPEVVMPNGKGQYEMYAWFFPYVNERLHALVQRHPEITLADWCAVSDKTGLTVDLIHLNTQGARLMTRTIVDAVLGPNAGASAGAAP